MFTVFQSCSLRLCNVGKYSVFRVTVFSLLIMVPWYCESICFTQSTNHICVKATEVPWKVKMF